MQGVHQGDPLSPLLFVLAAYLLQSVMNDALALGHVSLPIPAVSSQDFPVIQYASDMVLTLSACPRQIAHL